MEQYSSLLFIVLLVKYYVIIIAIGDLIYRDSFTGLELFWLTLIWTS